MKLITTCIFVSALIYMAMINASLVEATNAEDVAQLLIANRDMIQHGVVEFKIEVWKSENDTTELPLTQRSIQKISFTSQRYRIHRVREYPGPNHIYDSTNGDGLFIQLNYGNPNVAFISPETVFDTESQAEYFGRVSEKNWLSSVILVEENAEKILLQKGGYGEKRIMLTVLKATSLLESWKILSPEGTIVEEMILSGAKEVSPGIWYPMIAEYKKFKKEGSTSPVKVVKYTIIAADFSKVPSDSEFTLILEPGTYVMDNIVKTSYYVGGEN